MKDLVERKGRESTRKEVKTFAITEREWRRQRKNIKK